MIEQRLTVWPDLGMSYPSDINDVVTGRNRFTHIASKMCQRTVKKGQALGLYPRNG
jgi:hypothetical protein